MLNQATLTALGIRDAYLLEGISISEDELMALLQNNLSNNNSLIVEHSLAILPLGFADLLIVNVKTLRTKLSSLVVDTATDSGADRSGAWESINQPLLVNINGSEPAVCEDVEYDLIKSSLLKVFGSFPEIQDESHEATFSVKMLHLNDEKEAELVSSIGYPFLAGWLIGYVCIYYCTTDDGSSLVNRELEKTTIKVVNSDTSLSLVISEFSCPASILDVSHRRDTFQKALTAKLAAIQDGVDSRATKEAFRVTSRLSVILENSTHRLLAVSL